MFEHANEYLYMTAFYKADDQCRGKECFQLSSHN